MSTNKFIKKLDKDWFNNIKNNFKNKDNIDRENNQINLLKEISKTKTNIDLIRLQISKISVWITAPDSVKIFQSGKWIIFMIMMML